MTLQNETARIFRSTAGHYLWIHLLTLSATLGKPHRSVEGSPYSHHSHFSFLCETILANNKWSTQTAPRTGSQLLASPTTAAFFVLQALTVTSAKKTSLPISPLNISNLKHRLRFYGQEFQRILQTADGNTFPFASHCHSTAEQGTIYL